MYILKRMCLKVGRSLTSNNTDCPRRRGLRMTLNLKMERSFGDSKQDHFRWYKVKIEKKTFWSGFKRE